MNQLRYQNYMVYCYQQEECMMVERCRSKRLHLEIQYLHCMLLNSDKQPKQKMKWQ